MQAINFQMNITVEWVALLSHTQMVLASNLSPKTGYPDRILMVFFSPSCQMSG
jgi:hypothetical protein